MSKVENKQLKREIHFQFTKNTMETKDKAEIQEGCTYNQAWSDPEVVSVHLTKDSALDALKDHKTSVTELSTTNGRYYIVEEYYVEEVELNDMGEVEEFIGVLAFSKLP